ncbi:ABC transporter substrate-binding protein [Leifsonia sp. LS1]|uniref:ABC transporter substrate-binding protein n=1 Tax=Leifsonia sp. LS1 TaxID=2828483 RepID=UPI001CFF03D0|nr:ABC transporter substrate-binding protein [Leifsonia sp. LS1]GIT78848.1 ABC transporter substrate-binding protein [Leifsonia sp. LS1]
MKTHLTRDRRIRRLLPLAAIGATAALLITGCTPAATSVPTGDPTGKPVSGGTLTVAVSALPAVIDPYATSLQANWLVARNVCEPLFDVDTSFKVKPVLVDTSTYDGKQTYVLTLRSGVKFQDGQPLTAKDVIASLERYEQTPGNGSILKSLLASADATDDTTVTLHLNSPSLLIPTLLTTAYIMPASVVGGRPATEALTELDCTGPYTVASNVAGQQITLKKWSGYTSRTDASSGGTGAKHAYLDSIVFKPMPTDSTRMQAVQTGLVDWAIGTLDDYAGASTNASVSAALLAKQSSPTIVFNKISGVMANQKMRQAFQAALNMTDILSAGFGDPSNFDVDGSIFTKDNTTWHTEAGTKGAYNVHDAATVKSLLKDAGYTGQPITWYTTQDDPTWYGPAVPAQQELKKLGFNIDLQVVDQATIIAKRTDPSKYDIFSSAIPTYADPLLLPYLQATFPGGWKSTERDALLNTLSTSAKQSERKDAWDKLQTLIYTDVPFLKFGTVAGGTIAVAKGVHTTDGLANGGNQLFFNYWKSAK